MPHPNPAEIASALVIENTLEHSPAYRMVDERLYVVKQGSAYVMINILPWGKAKAMVRCVAQVVTGIRMDGELALELMELNAHLRFGAFAFDSSRNAVLFQHTILGGTTLDPDELLATVSDVALISDEYDDKLVDKYGGQRMSDLIEEAAVERMVEITSEDYEIKGPKGGKA